MRQFFYGDLKEADLTSENIILLSKLGVTDYIIDFDLKDPLTLSRLKTQGIKSYERVKLYSHDFTNFSFTGLESIILASKIQGCYGFALDLEAYSKSAMWQQDINYVELGYKIGNLISKYYKDLIIYPENLFGDKYINYPKFFSGLASSKLHITVLLERTYEEWLPWKMSKLIERTTTHQIDMYTNVDIFIGVWYESMSYWHFMKDVIDTNLSKALELRDNGKIAIWAKWVVFYDRIEWFREICAIPCQIVQWAYTRLSGNRFYYTESKKILTNKWLQLLFK